MALLDLVMQHVPKDMDTSKKSSLSSSKSTKFTSEVARKALNLMIILRPVTMVTILAKEVSSYLGLSTRDSLPSLFHPASAGRAVSSCDSVVLLLCVAGRDQCPTQYGRNSHTS